MSVKKVIIVAMTLITLTGFIGLGISNALKTKDRLEFQQVELKSKSAEIKQLNQDYDELNEQIDQIEEDKEVNQQEVDELQKEKQRLEEEKARLEAEIGALKQKQSSIARASEQFVNPTGNVQTASAASGGRTEWLKAAGIPQDVWWAVDCVIQGCNGVSPEGGWDGVTKWNTAGSGAYGICQSLPASKMSTKGADYMTNGLTQLKWCDEYAHSRYGGWVNAWNFRKCTGWCVNPKTGIGTNKDHTWW